MYFLSVLYLFLPAGLANMAPPFAAMLFPKANYPLDFRLKFRGHRLFGDHKTFRGLFSGIVLGLLSIYLQKYLDRFYFFNSLSLIDYSRISPLFGFSLGLGALMGDAVKSLFKRQIGVKPGHTWFPWDQIDWIIGSAIFAIPFIEVTLNLAITYLLVGLLAHLISKVIGFFLRINDTAF